jgi:hypothetical protein
MKQLEGQLKLFRVEDRNGKFIHYHLADSKSAASASVRRIHSGMNLKVRLENNSKKA